MLAFFIAASMNKAQTHFVSILAQTGNVTAAAQQSGIARSTVYYWRHHDAAFAASWEDAMSEATDRLALEARRRALEGVEEVRYFKGEPIGTIRRYSDTLLMFLLRAYRPAIYHNPEPRAADQKHNFNQARDELAKKLAQLAEQDDTAATLDTADAADTALATAQAARAALDPTAASTYGHNLAYTPAGQGAAYNDNAKVTYISPNFSGFTFGASFEDSDSAEDNPTSIGASYSMDLGGMGSGTSLTLTGGSYSNNADGSAKSSDAHYGASLSMGAMTLTASTYSGEHGDIDKDATEFGIGYQVSDELSLGAAFNTAESTGSVDTEGDFQSVSGSYSIAPGLKTTLAFNQFDVSDNEARTSNDGSSIVWQLEFGF